MKPTLTIISSPPYRGSRTVEKLEVAMVCAAFDMPSTILFRGAGLHALSKYQDTSAMGVRNVGKLINALPTYEIERIFVCAEDLAASAYTENDLVIPVQPIDREAQGKLIAEHMVVFGD